LVKEKEDLEKEGLKVVCGLQHPPVDASDDDLGRLKEYGVHFTSLAYIEKSEFGGGPATPEEELSSSGKAFIESLADHKIGLDLSHAGVRTAWDAVRYIQKRGIEIPVFASHSGCAEIYGHPRSLPDDVLRGVAELGGVVGIPIVAFLLHPTEVSVEPVLRHIRHAINLMGEDNVAIGSDLIYKRLSLEEHIANNRLVRREVGDMEDVLKIPVGSSGVPEGLNTSRLMEVLFGHLVREFGEEVARKIVGKSFMRFLKEKVFTG